MNYDELSQIYDAQYQTYRDDLHFYAQAAQSIGTRVLEIGAGTGRVTAHLARRGVRMVGIEPSAHMLQAAEQRLSGQGLDYELIQAKAQDFLLHERFDLIIAPFNALMHLYTPQEQLQAMLNIKQHLSPQGRFIFDLYVPRFGKMNTLRHEGDTFHHDERIDVFLVQRHDKIKQLITTEYFVDKNTDGYIKRDYYTLTQRYYHRYEIEWLLRCAGFQSIKITGSFQGGPLEKQSSVMLIQAHQGKE